MTDQPTQIRRRRSRYVIVRLTELEASALWLVVDNGWGGGDFSGWLGSTIVANATRRAMEKIKQARAAARSEQPT